MKNKLFVLFMAVIISLSIMPASIFAIDEDGEEDFYLDSSSYYVGEAKSGTIKAGSSVAFQIDTSSLYEQACNILVTNTSSNKSAKLTFSVLDEYGNPKTEISPEAACYSGSGSFPGAASSFDLPNDYWNDVFFNLSTDDYIVLEAGNADVSYTLNTQVIYSPLMLEGGEFLTKEFGYRAHLIPLDMEKYPENETVYIENNSYVDVRHFILADNDLVEDTSGYEWGLLEPDHWTDRGINFNHSKDYYLLIVPMIDNAEYDYEEYIDYDDYDDEDEDYYDDEDDEYYYDDDDDEYYYDDDEDYYDDDDEDYYDDDEEDYDEEEYYDYAVAISPQDLKYYKVEIDDRTYNGKTQKPQPKVTYDDIVLGTAIYSVTYSKNKSVGTAKVTIKGVAPNSGSITQSFKINPKGTSLSKPAASKKAITVKWKKQAAKMSKTRISGYEIQYSTNSKFTNAKTKVVKGYKKTSKKISGLKAKKKYYIRIRTYKKVNGKKYRSPWSAAKSIKTK